MTSQELENAFNALADEQRKQFAHIAGVLRESFTRIDGFQSAVGERLAAQSENLLSMLQNLMAYNERMLEIESNLERLAESSGTACQCLNDITAWCNRQSRQQAIPRPRKGKR